MLPKDQRRNTLKIATNIIIAVSTVLLVERSQLMNAMLSINTNYCQIPLSKEEVISIFNVNYKKFKEGKLDGTTVN